MISAITSIKIYNPYGDAYYANADKSSVEFPITDQCERSAKVMGEDFVRLQFKLKDRVTFDAFSFIEYDSQTFFLREQYTPKPNGTKKEEGGGISSTYYTYDVKFVSMANMLDKHVCYRHVKVDTKEWYEPEININGNLSTMYVIVMGAIKRVAKEYEHFYYGYLLNTLYMNGMAADGINPNTNKVRLTAGTKLLTFNFSGAKIANVCTTIANNFTNDDKKDTEWYITEEHGESLDQTTMTLHFAKCVSNEKVQTFGDYTKEDKSAYAFAHPYTTGGLKRVEYAQEWSGVINTIVPFGSDRNMSGQSVKGIDEITNMQSTFGKRLRLDIYDKEGNPMKYNVYDLEGREHEIEVDSRGGIRNNLVDTGIEEVKFFDDVYPQGHFRVEKVDIKNKRQDGETVPEYTITALPIDSKGNVIKKDDLSPVQAGGNGFYPIRIEEGTTLSVRFESGMLAGREFEIANKSHKDFDRPTYSMKFTIVADGSIEDGTLIPSGNFRPYGDLSTQTAEKAPSGVGDTFALFNMKMPDVYVEQAKQELAQKAFEELLKIQTTRPEVKCSTDPTNFNGDIALGNTINIESELFNTEGYTFHSRVISYSYKLTKTTDVQFSLASAIMQGTLSTMNDNIADVTQTTGGLEQRAVNLSRRAWRDASEMAEMLDSMRTEMMLVGEEKYQFAFTSAIECNNVSNKFAGLRIGYGSLQHTQEPYISYSNNGWWEISGQTLNKDEVEQPLDSAKAYYLYAKVDDTSTPAEMVLSENAYSTDVDTNTEYLLLGILSSEFEGQRVFNRTNGFSSIAGGTITTEQIQDAGRNLIIDFQSNPPRIIARNKAEIVGNIKFLSADGNEQTLNEAIGVIGGRNLLESTSFHQDYKIDDTVHFTKLINLEAGKKYIATYGKFENNAGEATNVVFNGVCLAISEIGGYLEAIESVIKFGESFEVNNDGRGLYIAWAHYDYINDSKGTSPKVDTRTAFTQYLDQVMLQEGEIATEFQEPISQFNYLTKVLKDGSTDIVGGLVMTNVLGLKDIQVNPNGTTTEKVTAGMSGLNDDNVLMWGGGNYNDAAHAAQNEYKKINGEDITTLLKKDGTGKIGVAKFGIDDFTVDTEEGKVVIDDNEGLSCHRPNQTEPVIKLTPKELLPIEQIRGMGIKKGESYSNDTIDYTTVQADGYGRPDSLVRTNEVLSYEEYVTGGGTITINGDVRADFIDANVANYVDLTDMYMLCTITRDNGDKLASVALRRETQSVYVPTTGNYIISFEGYVKLEGKSNVQWEKDARYQYALSIAKGYTFVSYKTDYTEAHRQTTIAHKGFFTYQGETAYFYYKDGVGLECKVGNTLFKISDKGIILDGLPNETDNDFDLLPVGTLYKDNKGFIKVVNPLPLQ